MSAPHRHRTAQETQHKCDRVLELAEKGVSYEAIAERLDIRQRDVSVYINKARKRRELLEGEK